jgi:hypothetical protein
VLLQAGLRGGRDLMPKSDMLPCKEQNFDFPVCNESLNKLRTVLNVKYNRSGDSGAMPIAEGKDALRKESDMIVVRKVKTNQDKEQFVLAKLFDLKVIYKIQ